MSMRMARLSWSSSVSISHELFPVTLCSGWILNLMWKLISEPLDIFRLSLCASLPLPPFLKHLRPFLYIEIINLLTKTIRYTLNIER